MHYVRHRGTIGLFGDDGLASLNCRWTNCQRSVAAFLASLAENCRAHAVHPLPFTCVSTFSRSTSRTDDNENEEAETGGIGSGSWTAVNENAVVNDNKKINGCHVNHCNKIVMSGIFVIQSWSGKGLHRLQWAKIVNNACFTNDKTLKIGSQKYADYFSK